MCEESRYEWLEGPAVNVLPMTDFHHDHNKLSVLYRVNDSIDALANSITVSARKFLTTWWARIVSEAADPIRNSLSVFLSRNGLEFFGRGKLDQDFKSCHAVSDP